MGICEIEMKYIDEIFLEDPDPNFDKLNSLKTSEELHYLATILNWDIHLPILQWISENPLCTKATGLMMFWLAQPKDFTKYMFQAEIKEGQDVFHLIKTIMVNYQNNFYKESEIHYNPEDMMKLDSFRVVNPFNRGFLYG